MCITALSADKLHLLSSDKSKVEAELQDAKRKLDNVTIALEEASIIEGACYSPSAFLRSRHFLSSLFARLQDQEAWDARRAHL